MKSLRYLALGALVWAAMSASAFASTQQYSFASAWALTCPDGPTEMISFNQTQTFDSALTIDSNGGRHLNMRVRWSGTGVGLTSGATYQTDGSRILIDNVAADLLPSVFNWSYTMRYIGQASAPNIFFVMRGHSTVDANGNTTSDVSTDSVTCH